MSLMARLEPGEEVVARSGPFYATSRRVLRFEVDPPADFEVILTALRAIP